MSAPAAASVSPPRLRAAPSTLRAAQWALTLAVGGAWLAYVLWHASYSGRAADFSWVYSIGDLLRHEGPSALYDFSALSERMARYFPAEPGPLPFVRPPFYALLVAPFSLLSPVTAQLVWLLLNAAAFVAATRLIAGAIDREWSEVAWHAVIFFPAFYSFYNRQDLGWLLLPVAASYYLVARHRPFAAGLVLSLAAVKFHLWLLVPVVFLVHRKRAALAGLAAGGAVLLAVSLLLVGPSGLARYADILLRYPQPNTYFPERTCNLWALAPSPWLWIPLLAAMAAALRVAFRRLPLPEALAAAWLGSLVLTPHVYLSDYLLALPAFLLLARLGKFCFFASLPALFPVTPILMQWSNRFLLVTTVAALLCLFGAAWRRPAPS